MNKFRVFTAAFKSFTFLAGYPSVRENFGSFNFEIKTLIRLRSKKNTDLIDYLGKQGLEIKIVEIFLRDD